LQLQLATATPWAKAGHVVAREQWELREYNYPGKPSASELAAPRDSVTSDSVIFSGDGYNISIDANSGAVTSYTVAGQEYLRRPLEPYFWKPTNRNQANNANGYLKRLGAWRTAAQDRVLEQVTNSPNAARFEFRLPVNDAKYVLEYNVGSAGELSVRASYEPTDHPRQGLMPKFGMRMGVPAQLNQIQWYGRGPHENYEDRNWGAPLGEYKLPLRNYWTNYAHPQDNGNRTAVRWWECRAVGEKKAGMRIEGLQELNIRAWPYDESDIESSKLAHQLPQRDHININVDLRVHGVGGDNSWGKRTMAKYTLPASEPHEYGFVLMPTP